MAINPETQYPGKISPSTPEYPYGAARNVTVPGDGTGTPWEAALVNDILGFFQAILSETSIVPTGTPEKATDSQLLKALTNLFENARPITFYGAESGASEAANTTAIQNAIDDGQKLLYVPAGTFNVTALSYGFDVTFFGPGKIIPSAEFQTEQYGGLQRAGIKIGNTLPLDKHGGFIVGGEGPTEHGPMLKSQYNASMDMISSREGNPLEFQLYPNQSSGVVTANGSGRVVFSKGFNGSLSNVYVNDLFWVNGVVYRVATVVDSNTIDLLNEPGGGAAAIPAGDYSAHHLYFTVDTTVNISGVTISRAAGEAFQPWGSEHNFIIDGVVYSATPTDSDNSTVSSAPGDATDKQVVFRWLSDENFVELLRWQRLLGQGTEETYSIAAKPDEYLHRVGYTGDGIGRASRVRFETDFNDSDPFPNNTEPKSALVLEDGKVGIGKLSPEAVLHPRARFDAAQGADDGIDYPIAVIEGAWNSGEGGTRRLVFEAHNDFSAPGPQGRTTVGGAVARLNVNGQGGTVGIGTDAGSHDGHIWAGNAVKPDTDNTYPLGTAPQRWSEVFAGNGTIQTSDADLKTEPEQIPDEWLDAWGDVEYMRFKFKDAVDLKGGDARWHVGVIAQRVRDAFLSRDLDPFAIGVLCFDEWDDEWEVWDDIYKEWDDQFDLVKVGVFQDRPVYQKKLIKPAGKELVKEAGRRLVKPAGSIYGIRYEEALVLEAAYTRREIERLKS